MMQAESPIAWGMLLFLAVLWGINKLREYEAWEENRENELDAAHEEWEEMFQ